MKAAVSKFASIAISIVVLGVLLLGGNGLGLNIKDSILGLIGGMSGDVDDGLTPEATPVYVTLYNSGELVFSAEPNVQEDVLKDYGDISSSSYAYAWKNEADKVTTATIKDTIRPETTKNWFANCKNMTAVNNMSNLDMRRSTSTFGMFQGCTGLISLDLSSWDTKNVSDMQGMFVNCKNLKTVELSNKFNTGKVENFHSMFSGCTGLTSLDVSNWDMSSAKVMQAMFQNCSSLEVLDVSDWNVSSATNLSYVFNKCKKVKELDVSNWNVGSVTTTKTMFQNCEAVKELDVSKWNVSNVKDMSYMFYYCPELLALDVSDWNVGNVTSMYHMMAHCSKLSDFDVSNWDVSNVTNLNGIFHSTKETYIDVSKWNTSKCESFAQMFDSCTNLQEIKGLEKLDTSLGKNFFEMFNGCTSLEVLDLSNMDTSKAYDSWVDPVKNSAMGLTDGYSCMAYMFKGMDSLKEIKFGSNFSFNGNGECRINVELPNPANVSGFDGNWYNSKGEEFVGTSIPNRTADTYYAVK